MDSSLHRRPRARLYSKATALLCCLMSAGLAAQTRVACLGDSITYGARIADRDHNSYPGWLNDFLGKPYEVRNFGVGGATLLQAADRPYVKTKAFRDALAWQPHVAFVMLGTNDTCENERRHNWRHADSLAADAAQLVASLQEVRNDMRIVLCSPTPMFAQKRGLKPARKADLETRGKRLAACAQAMQTVARTTDNVAYLELRNTLTAAHVSDGVHPTAFGAERIARRIAEAIRSPVTPSNLRRNQLDNELKERDIPTKADTFHGFDGITFQLPQTAAQCRVFFPKGTAKGTPWVLRARFFGHQPALDIALLERGFHLAYCDVSNLYGSQLAIDRYLELHSLLADAGFNQRAVLEGMSRGGLQIINWATAYPQRVAAIYGDNPVVDIRSWPGGNSGKRSAADWQRCMKVYGLDEESAKTFEPVDVSRLKPLALEGIPMMLVLGMDDKVVPITENGNLLAERYAKAGGQVDVWRKPGNGHHPHGLHPVDPLLRAILRATGFAQGITTTASPSVESRSGAGWHGDSWRTQVDKMRALAKLHPDVPVVFLGDSITQGLTGSRDRLATANGTRAIDKAFGKQGAISLGLSGDRTEHLLYRIEHGALQELSPKVIVLQIGVNNVVTGKHTANEVHEGIWRVALGLNLKAHVLVCGPFPAGARGSLIRQTVDSIHDTLQLFNKTKVWHGGKANLSYLDLRDLFLDEDGTCNQNMRDDRIHISGSGQEAWMQAISTAIKKLDEDR